MSAPLADVEVRPLTVPVPGAVLDAWLVCPARGTPWPVVIAAHGWGAVKEMNLDYLAAAIVATNQAAIVFDHRGFGSSTGLAGDVDPIVQIADYMAVIGAACAKPEIDGTRVGIWGTSYSGGHVLCVAARDRRVKAAVSQVPTVSGSETDRRRYSPELVQRLTERFAADRAAVCDGAAPSIVAAVRRSGLPSLESISGTAPRAGQLPPAPAERYENDSSTFYGKLPPARRTTWTNTVTLRSVERYSYYEPGREMRAAACVPLLVIAAENDTITPTDQILDAFPTEEDQASLLTVPGGHYDVYASQRDAVNGEAAAFLNRYL